jgi:hypothetical protein
VQSCQLGTHQKTIEQHTTHLFACSLASLSHFFQRTLSGAVELACHWTHVGKHQIWKFCGHEIWQLSTYHVREPDGYQIWEAGSD